MPLEQILPVVLSFLGLVLGYAACWLFLRSKLAAVTERIQGRANTEIAILKADLNNRDLTIEQLKAECEHNQAEIRKLRKAVIDHRVHQQKLVSRITYERQQASEKLEFVNDAQKRLADTFKVLSTEVLKNSNKSFLQLANETFEKFQGIARGDLEKRKQAIDTLLKPVETSLKQVDG